MLSRMVKVHAIYYSTYGHTKTLIDAVVRGLKRGGVEVEVFAVPETLSADILTKMHAADLTHNAGVPLVQRDTWHIADGFIFGAPTRFGMMAAQMKAFWDSTGHLWSSGGLAGKPAGWVTSTATQNGGQETTIMTAVTQLAHHGMIFVPQGYAFGKLQFDNSYSHGVSPWGISTLAGATGADKPRELELEAAELYGEKFAKVTIALAAAKPADTAGKV